MGVHLLRQLAGDLDRLHLRRERATENPFDKVLYPLLQVSQNADLRPSVIGERRSKRRLGAARGGQS